MKQKRVARITVTSSTTTDRPDQGHGEEWGSDLCTFKYYSYPVFPEHQPTEWVGCDVVAESPTATVVYHCAPAIWCDSLKPRVSNVAVPQRPLSHVTTNTSHFQFAGRRRWGVCCCFHRNTSHCWKTTDITRGWRQPRRLLGLFPEELGGVGNRRGREVRCEATGTSNVEVKKNNFLRNKTWRNVAFLVHSVLELNYGMATLLRKKEIKTKQ